MSSEKAASQLRRHNALNNKGEAFEDAVLREDATHLQEVVAAGMDCLLPFEIEDYRETGELDDEQRAHLQECDSCLALIAATPNSRKTEEFLDEVRKLRNQAPFAATR